MAATVRGPIYCEAVLPPEDVYFEGSEDEDYESAAERRKRYDAAGQKFLSGTVPFLLSASLQGPFDEASGWVNPWRSKNRTAQSQTRLDSEPLGSRASPTQPPTSASSPTEAQAIEVLKHAEFALPSPESLKQAPFTAAHPWLRDNLVEDGGLGDEVASLTPTKDDTDPWIASSPSRKLRKKRSKSSIGVDSASKKRRKTGTTKTEISTPTSGRRVARSDTDGRTSTSSATRNSSIYAHIRELTSKLPRQDLSSDDEIGLDDDDSDAFLTSQSVVSSSSNIVRSPWKDLSNEALLRRLNPSSSFSSPPRRSTLFGALSPVSNSSAQTPTKRAVFPASSPGRLPSMMNGLSPTGTPTRPWRISDLDMLDVDDDAGNGAEDKSIVPETQLQEEELPLLKSHDVNDVNHINGVAVPVLPAATASRSDCEKPASTSDETTASHNTQDDPVRNLKSTYENLSGPMKPIRATPPRQMAHPVIYDDAEGGDRSSPRSSITASSSLQQPAASQNEVANSPRGSRLAKTTTLPKSSALQSLSPRNGRINSRPALKKAVRSYMSSPLRPSAPSANRSHRLHPEDGQQSKENVGAKEANESPLPLTKSVNISTPQPILDEAIATSTPETDPSQADKVQEDPIAPDAAASSTAASSSLAPLEITQPTAADAAVSSSATSSSLAPPEVTQPTQMDDTRQSDELPNVPESAEPILTQENSPTELQPSVPMEDAGSGMIDMQASGNTSEKPDVSESAGPVTDGHAPAQEQQEQTLGPTDAGERLVLPPQSCETHQPPSEEMPPPSNEESKRPSTPEPQFAFTSFSSFMSPSPSHRHQVRYSWDGVTNGIGPTSRGILLSGRKGASRSTTSKKRVSWAPLPHEETASTGEEISSETDTSSSPSRGRDRAVSPPPPPSTSRASDSLEERDMKFSHHFAAVADRSKGTQLHSTPTASEDGTCSTGIAFPVAAAQIVDPTEVSNSTQVSLDEAEKAVAKSTGGWDGSEEATDIVEDIFNEMDDFLQIWDVDAELKEARKADKARPAGEKKPGEAAEVDMGMDVDMDISSRFFF